MAREKNIRQDDINCRLTDDWRTKEYPSEQPVYYAHRPVRVFLAGPWFWPEAEITLATAFEILNADKRLDVWCALMHGKLDMKSYCSLRSAMAENVVAFAAEWDRQKEAAFQRDLYHMRWCDLLVGMIENWDSGTMFEMGGVRVLKKPCIAFSYNLNRECNLMLERAIVGFTTNVHDLIPMIEQKILCKIEKIAPEPGSRINPTSLS